MDALVVGVDVGGTSTHVGVGRRDGTLLGVVRGPGGNPNAVGVGPAGAQLRTLVATALVEAEVRAADVAALTVAMAGATRILGSATELADLVDQVSVPGLAVRPEIVLDVAAAFAAGAPADAGTVLVAGTGSIAAQVARGQVVRRVGGWGWLLGDEGAGFWLGREAVRHTLSAPADQGALTTAVRQAYDAADSDDLLAAAYAAAPLGLARLGQRVAELAAVDLAAAAIIDRAATHLVALVAELASAEPDLELAPIVLAGSVLTTDGPVGGLVRDRLAATGRAVVTAGPAVVGPVWLAARSLGALDPEVHRRFRSSTDL